MKFRNKYAILFAGNADPRHRFNLCRARAALTKNGFLKENIYLLENQAHLLVSLPKTGNGTFANLRTVCNYLEPRITEDDLLFFYVTGHGTRIKRKIPIRKTGEIVTIESSGIPTTEGIITSKDLEETLAPLNPRTGVYLFDQCRSGEFAVRIAHSGRMKNPRNIGIAASRSFEPSWASSFPNEFFTSFTEPDISIGYAFEKAVAHDANTVNGNQVPMMHYDKKKVDPSQVFLSY